MDTSGSVLKPRTGFSQSQQGREITLPTTWQEVRAPGRNVKEYPQRLFVIKWIATSTSSLEDFQIQQ